MKKLIALAAVALVGSAFATPCQLNPTTTTTVTNAAVYAWKFVGKTTQGVLVGNVNKGTAGSVCTLGTTNTYDNCYIRVPASLAIQGYTYICDNCCAAFDDGTAGYTLSEFYQTKPQQSGLTPTITFDVAHIIGKKATQCEIEGDATFVTKATGLSEKYTLRFAGLGTVNQTKQVVASCSGNFAGKVASPYYVKNHVCAPADYWTCAIVFAGDPTADSVAYGTWSVKYNASASTKYRNYGYTISIPSFAK